MCVQSVCSECVFRVCVQSDLQTSPLAFFVNSYVLIEPKLRLMSWLRCTVYLKDDNSSVYRQIKGQERDRKLHYSNDAKM